MEMNNHGTNPTVKELMYFCLDDSFQEVEIYNNVTQEEMYVGQYCKMPKEYKDFIVGSWNVRADCGIAFNVDIEE